MEPCKPEKVEDWIQFLDQVFLYEQPLSFGIDFAPLFLPQNLENSRIIYKDGQIAASASLFEQSMIIPDASYRIGIIAAVATHPNFRNQGFSTQILEEMEMLGREKNLDALVLWSQQEEFYEKVGFKTFGKQELYSLGGFNYEGPPQGLIIPGWDEPGKLSLLYREHAMRSDRTDEYWNCLTQIKSVQRYHLKNTKSAEITAYVGIGRGKDMQNIIHEWGGEAESLRYLLKQILMRSQELIWLTHPNLKDPIREILPENSKVQSGVLGLIKCLNSIPQKSQDQIWFWGLDSM